jgi:hypothetical protein
MYNFCQKDSFRSSAGAFATTYRHIYKETQNFMPTLGLSLGSFILRAGGGLRANDSLYFEGVGWVI